jgi:RNA recognition motif-containing protein
MVKLFVSGFPLDMDEIELVKLFSSHGDVRTIKLVRDKKTRVCKGYGFIEMADQQAAENVIAALNKQHIGDRQLTINIREEEEPAATLPRPYKPPVYQKVQKPSDPLRKKRPRRSS